jgi:hypothetical protein
LLAKWSVRHFEVGDSGGGADLINFLTCCAPLCHVIEVADDHSTLWLLFDYYPERDADLLILRRSDGSFVATFSTRGVGLFEVELMAWNDAD